MAPWYHPRGNGARQYRRCTDFLQGLTQGETARVNLASIAKMPIRVGGRPSLIPGAGVLHLDDISVGHPAQQHWYGPPNAPLCVGGAHFPHGGEQVPFMTPWTLAPMLLG